jgi:hypothetical protein
MTPHVSDRLGLKRVVTATTNLIKRVHLRAPALIEELDGVAQVAVERALAASKAQPRKPADCGSDGGAAAAGDSAATRV